MATVNTTPDALKELARMPAVIRQRIRKIFWRLKSWPNVSGVKALSGDLAGWYRVRTGDYRVRFRVKGDIVTVDKIAHRKDVYED